MREDGENFHLFGATYAIFFLPYVPYTFVNTIDLEIFMLWNFHMTNFVSKNFIGTTQYYYVIDIAWKGVTV